MSDWGVTDALRRAAVSGRFYPHDPRDLERTIDTLLETTDTGAPPTPAIAGIAPHAGYRYSGLTAACLFRRVTWPSLVVILAPNHTGRCDAPGGASLWARGAFATPLGEVAVDETFGEALAERSPLVSHDPAAHRDEHAVEVELPLLRRLRPDARIVPVVLAWDDWPRCRQLAASLAEQIRAWPEPVFLLASSDLNHYESAVVAEPKERAVLAEVERLDGAGLLDVCRRRAVSMCGRAPSAVVVEAARRLGARRATVLDHRHSGWVTGDDSQVVGYAAVVLER